MENFFAGKKVCGILHGQFALRFVVLPHSSDFRNTEIGQGLIKPVANLQWFEFDLLFGLHHLLLDKPNQLAVL